MRTILALTREETFKTMYIEAVKVPHRIAIKGSFLTSFGFAASQGTIYFIWALSFWYGGQLVINKEYDV
jgi:hypothetical protein